MTRTSEIEAIVALQSQLMAALDARDVDGIEQATAALAKALETVRRNSAIAIGGEDLRDRVGHALKQSEALKTRVNFMALRNREKMEKLAEARGLAAPNVYGNGGKPRIAALTA